MYKHTKTWHLCTTKMVILSKSNKARKPIKILNADFPDISLLVYLNIHRYLLVPCAFIRSAVVYFTLGYYGPHSSGER